MTTVLVLNGPNLNMLGKRDPSQYGSTTLEELEKHISDRAKTLDVIVKFLQSNYEGDLVEFVQQNSSIADGIIINPAGLTTNGYSLVDACIDSKLPVLEVHLSNLGAREHWRDRSAFTRIAVGYVAGLKWKGYIAALEYFVALTKGEI